MKRTALLLLALTACSYSSTHVTDVYRAPGLSKLSFNKVAAIAIVKDPSYRKTVEDEMAKQIGAKGVAGYTVLSDDDMRSADSVKAKLQSLNIDGVVTMELLSLGDEPMDVRGEIPDSYKQFSGYYGAARERGPDDMEKVARIETQIFSIPENKLLWSAETKTFEPSKARETVTAVAKAVGKELREQQLMK